MDVFVTALFFFIDGLGLGICCELIRFYTGSEQGAAFKQSIWILCVLYTALYVHLGTILSVITENQLFPTGLQ